MRALAALVLTAASLLTPGCTSAFFTVAGDHDQPYVGTLVDAAAVVDGDLLEGAPHLRILAALDLPFSFALDTLFLPITLTSAALD